MDNLKRVIIPAAKIVPAELKNLESFRELYIPSTKRLHSTICMKNIKNIVRRWILFALNRQVKCSEGSILTSVNKYVSRYSQNWGIWDKRYILHLAR